MTPTKSAHSKGDAPTKQQVFICVGVTKLGSACKRRVQVLGGSCYQHTTLGFSTDPNITFDDSGVIESRAEELGASTQLFPNIGVETIPYPGEVIVNHCDPPKQSKETCQKTCQETPKAEPEIVVPSSATLTHTPNELTRMTGCSSVELDPTPFASPALATEVPDPLDEEEKMLRDSFWEKAKIVTGSKNGKRAQSRWF